jgi:hypothetical protein
MRGMVDAIVSIAQADDRPDHWVVRLNEAEVIAFTGPDARHRAEVHAEALEERMGSADRPTADAETDPTGSSQR